MSTDYRPINKYEHNYMQRHMSIPITTVISLDVRVAVSEAMADYSDYHVQLHIADSMIPQFLENVRE